MKKKRKKLPIPDRQRPPAAKRELAEVLAVALGALLLRLVGLSWGVPQETHFYSYHPDEILLMRPLPRMLAGDWNPHFFIYGTLYIYIAAFFAKAATLLHLIPAEGLGSTTGYYLTGRAVTALFGAGTVALVYLIGRDLGGRRLGLIGALLLALAPLHLVNSHFATVDVPGAFFVVLSAWAAARIAKEGRLRWYLLGGAAAGLAAAVKYNLGLAIVLPVGAHFLRGNLPPREHLRLLAALLALPAAFLLGCPHALSWEGGLHWREEFLTGLLFGVYYVQEVRTTAFEAAGSPWAYHAWRGLPAALGIPLYLLAAAGLGYIVARGPKEPPCAKRILLLLAVWCGLFFVATGTSKECFIRYLVPLAALLSIFAAVMIDKLWQNKSPAHRAALAAALLLWAINCAYALGQLALFVVADPRDRGLAALQEMAPQSVGIVETPWFTIPPLSPYNGGPFSQEDFEEWQAAAPYEVIVTGWQAEALAQAPPQAFVVSDLQFRDLLRLQFPAATEFMQKLESAYPARQDFRPATPLDWLGGGRRRFPPDWLYLKPEVYIYHGTANSQTE